MASMRSGPIYSWKCQAIPRKPGLFPVRDMDDATLGGYIENRNYMVKQCYSAWLILRVTYFKLVGEGG
jgi:hypothetical protein